MTLTKSQKSDFQRELKKAIVTKGYWSTDVKLLNDNCQSKVSHHIWKKWHDQTLAEVRR